MSYNQLKPYLRWYQWSSPSIRDVVSLPGECGADMSPLAAIIDDDVHAKAMKLSDEDRRTLYFWLDANIPFYGTYDPGEQARQRDGEAIAVQALQ